MNFFDVFNTCWCCQLGPKRDLGDTLEVNYHELLDFRSLLQKGVPSAVETFRHAPDSAEVLHATDEWWELKASLAEAAYLTCFFFFNNINIYIYIHIIAGASSVQHFALHRLHRLHRLSA